MDEILNCFDQFARNDVGKEILATNLEEFEQKLRILVRKLKEKLGKIRVGGFEKRKNLLKNEKKRV